MAAVALWDILFLNAPALRLVVSGFVNTFVIALLVVAITLALAWGVTLALHYLEKGNRKSAYMVLTFFLNLIRSIPQIVGVLFGYVAVAALIQAGALRSPMSIFPLLAFSVSLFVFIEFVDLMRERIAHFAKLDFYNAMRVCGITEGRIVNFDILWKNSRIHILNKLISIFGVAIFLQCSVDFIISVGLSTDVNTVTLPATLGGLLANIDSKQDVLAIGYTLTHPSYAPNLFFEHLQGVTVAFLIVFSLLSLYHIANGYAERHRL
jgi:ABC-type amino acid transport system permease subunit